MTEPDLNLHPDIQRAFTGDGGLFDVPVADLHANIGRRIIRPRDNGHYGNFEARRVTSVQRTFDGSLAYRVQRNPEDFGFPCRPHEITFLSEDEALVELDFRSDCVDEEDAGGFVLIHRRTSIFYARWLPEIRASILQEGGFVYRETLLPERAG